MTITPPSGRQEYRGLSAFYDSEIAPFLRDHEANRIAAVKRSIIVVAVATPLVLAMVLLGPFGNANLHVAALTGFSAVALASFFLNKARNQIAAGLLERICGFLGFTYKQELSRPAFAFELDRMKLFPSYNREEWEDEVIGERHGARFVLCEAKLKKVTQGKNRRVKTVFHGQLLVVDYPKEFLGETIIRRDAGMLNRLMKPGKEYQNVGLVSSKFEKAFEAWSTDQVEARELLDPLVLERFEELERLFDGVKFRAAFSKGKLFVVLESGDKLNMGSMFQSLEQPARVELIMKEFDLIFDLIDVALKQVETPLAGAVTAAAFR